LLEKKREKEKEKKRKKKGGKTRRGQLSSLITEVRSPIASLLTIHL